MDIKPDLKRYLAQKGWKWKRVSDHDIAIQTCPFCQRSKYKFWIDAKKTIYRCFNCEAKGNLYKLKRELGDLKAGLVSAARMVEGGEDKDRKQQGTRIVPMKNIEVWHKKLLKSEKGMAYLEGRGFKKKTIKHFKLGLQIKNGKRWLAIPHINNGQCLNVKFRSLSKYDKQFRRIKGCASVLFNADCLADYEEVLIVEAELDAISYWQAGIYNVVALTCGADTFLPEWYDLLNDKDRITIALDADAVGQSGAREIGRRLGFDKCYNVLLPLHDANDILLHLGPSELAKTVDDPERFEVEGVIRLGDVLKECREYKEIETPGYLTPWPSFNRFIGQGWQPGDLIILGARVKIGKTTWSLEVSKHLASQGIPALFYCLEMKTRRLGDKVTANFREKNVDTLIPLDYSLTRYYLNTIPLYFMDPKWAAKLKAEGVFNRIRESVKRYGIKFLVFDNLHFLCRSLQYVTQEVGQLTRGFKLLSEELEIVTCLIAQPRKVQMKGPIGHDDLKDSASIPADADQIIILHRNKTPSVLAEDIEASVTDDREAYDPKMLVRVDASRFGGGGETYLHYEGAESRIVELADRPVPEA
jgi:hypothetical protein